MSLSKPFGLTWAQIMWLVTNEGKIAAMKAEFDTLGSAASVDEAHAREKTRDVLHEAQRQIDRATERDGN